MYCCEEFLTYSTLGFYYKILSQYGVSTVLSEQKKEKTVETGKEKPVERKKDSKSEMQEKTKGEDLSKIFQINSETFFKHIEDTLEKRYELIAILHLKYLRFWKNSAESLFDYQNDFLAKIGMRFEAPKMYEQLINSSFIAVRDYYENQNRYIETVLNVATSTQGMVNDSIRSIANLSNSTLLWWIPPVTKS